MSYWGLWMEDETLIPELNDKTITKFNYGDSSATTNYTAHVAPGKATLRKANAASLAEFNTMEFYGWIDHPSPDYGFPNDGTNTFDTWLIRVNGEAFEVTGGVNWGTGNGPTITSLTPETIDMSSWPDGHSIWLWSDALGGNVVFTKDSTLGNKVVFYQQEFIYPSDIGSLSGDTNSITLHCYDRCPKGGLTQTAIEAMTSQEDLYYTQGWHTYTLVYSSGVITLRDSSAGDAHVSIADLDLTSLGMDWGLQSGEMVRDNSALLTDPWMIYQASETFRWETGSQNWNRMVTVTDANGATVTLDKPLQFTYVVDAADVLNASEATAFGGKTLLLEYGGDGSLWGFPWAPMDSSCTSNDCRWIPGVNLKNGTELGPDSDSNGYPDFVVKALEREQTMNAGGDCSGLSIGGVSLTLPTGSDLGSVAHTWAQRPIVTDAPAVIEGVVQ